MEYSNKEYIAALKAILNLVDRLPIVNFKLDSLTANIYVEVGPDERLINLYIDEVTEKRILEEYNGFVEYFNRICKEAELEEARQ